MACSRIAFRHRVLRVCSIACLRDACACLRVPDRACAMQYRVPAHVRASKHVVEGKAQRPAPAADEGPHHNVVPRANREENRLRLPQSKKTSFFMGPTRSLNQVVPT